MGGMTPIEQKIKALKNFQATAPEQIIVAAKKYEAEIIDANTAQLEQGKEATGQPVTPGYRPLTIQIKRAKGQPTNRVTLKDTGDFHDSFKARFQAQSISIFATDEKAERLERKYGEDIYGLNNRNLQELINDLKPDMIKRLQKAI